MKKHSTFQHINYFSIVTQAKKNKNNPLLSLFIYWLMQVCILTMALTLSFLY